MVHSLVLALATRAQSKIIRHMDFHFGITVRTTNVNHSSGIGSAGGPISGVMSSTSSGSNQGTITVDVVGLRSDNGLVVNVTETSRTIPHPNTMQCITWGIGTVVCEPGEHTTPEEQTLLRFLGRDFVNAAAIDAKNHWSVGTSGKEGSETSDYDITSNNAGVMNISFQRVTETPGVQGFNATTNGKLTYDANLTVPRSITEDTLLRTSLVGGNVVQGGYEQVHTMLNISLLDDSFAKAQ